MPSPQSLSSTPRGGLFHEGCESASENFLYRVFPQRDKKSDNWLSNAKSHTKTIFGGLTSAFLCCFGDRHESVTLQDLGVDLPVMFPSARTCATSSHLTDQSTTTCDRSQFLWVITPSQSHMKSQVTFKDARWMILSWISRIVNGEKINRKMLNSLMADACGGKASLDIISDSVIRSFPGLQLAANIQSKETCDHAIAIDSITEALEEHSSPDRVEVAILMNKDSFGCVIYFNRRDDCRDMILLEVDINNKNQLLRTIAFHRLDDMRRYMMGIELLKTLSTIYYYTFTMKCPQLRSSGLTMKHRKNPCQLKRTVLLKNVTLESEDPRKDAKIVFSQAKLVAKM